MCGIAGVAGIREQQKGVLDVRAMTAAMARRGPDGEGLTVLGDTVLGHRRLAIFDLSEAGRQPMVSADRTAGVVFNGAIYNYRQLREELVAAGYAFVSKTDTEVLIHGYAEWGIDLLVAKLRGMFAFAIWDNTLRKLFLVRDRLGVKPMVFVVRDGTIAFASTVRALRAAGYVSELDPRAILDFLSFGFINDDRSIYSGAVKVAAASIVEWSKGELSCHRYWTVPAPQEQARCSFEEAVEETEKLLLESVAIRLHADVPVAAMLSGGIDSGLVCWAIARLGADVTAYTIGIRNDPWDETRAARSTAMKVGIRHCLLEMSDSSRLDVNELTSAYAEPFASASALGMLYAARAIGSSAKVLLTGDGGDDVFLGYPRHRHLWLAGKLGDLLPTPVKQLWQIAQSVVPTVGPLRRAVSLMDYATDGFQAFINKSDGLQSYTTQGLLGDRLLGMTAILNHGTFEESNFLAELLAYERRTRFTGEYMTKVDGATMHYGLEARSPFLDHMLWEFASGLPFGLRLRSGYLKSILRELARRRIGPAAAIRRKHGFGVPVHRWIARDWRAHIEETFQDSILDRENWIRMEPALGELKLAGDRGWASHQLWYIFVLESWIRHERDCHERHYVGRDPLCVQPLMN